MVTNEDRTYQFCKTRHQLLLEALRHREQEVLKYLVIIGPALGGFVWLMSKYPKEISALVFCLGSLGLIFISLLGSCYCIALGYNYRTITFQIAKDEENMKVSGRVLRAWPRTKKERTKRTKLGHYFKFLRQRCGPKVADWPWCFPPEVILVFWYGFVVGIIYLTTATCIVLREHICTVIVAGIFGFLCLVLSLFVPHMYGKKLRSVCHKEEERDEPPECVEQNVGKE